MSLPILKERDSGPMIYLLTIDSYRVMTQVPLKGIRVGKRGEAWPMSARLLVVECDPAERLVAAQALQRDYEVATASDASEARGKLISGLIDVLVCDVNLPGESGMELIRSLLDRDDADIAVVAIADEDSPELAAEVFEVGA